jgi:hypothetical protein
MYTENNVGVDCTVLCLKRVLEGVLKSMEVFWSILEFLGFLESTLEWCVEAWRGGERMGSGEK